MSDAPASETQRPRRRLRKFVITLLILAAGTGAVLLVMHLIGRSAVAAREAAIRAAGDPLTFDQLIARRPAIPDDQNGARVLEPLLPALESVDAAAESVKETLPRIGDARLPEVGQPYDAEALATIQKFVADHAVLLTALDKIEGYPRGSIDTRPPIDPIGWLLPHLKLLRTAARLESLAGIDNARAGQIDEAMNRARIILNIAATVEHEGTLISTLVMSACDSLAAGHVERVLSAGVSSPDALRNVAVSLKRHEESDALLWGMWGERIFQRSLFDLMRSGKAQAMMVPPPPAPSPLLRVLSGWTAMNEAKTMAMMTRKVEIARAPENKSAQLNAMDRQIQNLSAFYVLTRMALPSLTRSVQIWNRRTAELRCVRTAIAAELFRMDHGRWPASLDDLIPRYLDTMPLDPFDGKTLRYAVVNGDIVVYSKGEDGTDDGGALVQSENRRATDYGCRLLAPDRRGVMVRDPDSEPPAATQPSAGSSGPASQAAAPPA